MDSYYSLTKTLILSGIQCEKKLWFDLNDKIKLKDKAIFRSGNRFNDVVRKHYGEGLDLSDEKEHQIVIERTKEAIQSDNINVIYEAGFLFKKTFIRADVLIKKDNQWTMLEAKAEINESKRRARIFLSSFPSGFNPAFYGENINNNAFSTSSIDGGYLFKQNGDLYHNGNQIPNEGIVESLPDFNNIYDDEINWTQNNVEINMSNSGANSNNKYLQFDGNDYVKINYTTTTTGTENIVLDFESGLNFGSNTWSNIPSDYKGFTWGPGDPGDPGGPNGRYMRAARGNWYNTWYPSNGYQHGLSSGENIIFNSWNEQNVYFKTPDGSLFNFIKLHAAAAWQSDQRLYIKGYRNGENWLTKKFKREDHNEKFWRKRFHIPIKFFFHDA